jgi:hypothetical protein
LDTTIYKGGSRKGDYDAKCSDFTFSLKKCANIAVCKRGFTGCKNRLYGGDQVWSPCTGYEAKKAGGKCKETFGGVDLRVRVRDIDHMKGMNKMAYFVPIDRVDTKYIHRREMWSFKDKKGKWAPGKVEGDGGRVVANIEIEYSAKQNIDEIIKGSNDHLQLSTEDENAMITAVGNTFNLKKCL